MFNIVKQSIEGVVEWLIKFQQNDVMSFSL